MECGMRFFNSLSQQFRCCSVQSILRVMHALAWSTLQIKILVRPHNELNMLKSFFRLMNSLEVFFNLSESHI